MVSKRSLQHLMAAGSAALLTLAAAGCSSREGPQWEPEKKIRSFKMATRQLPPEPVYNAVAWVRPPQVTPTRRYEASRAPVVMPIIEFSVDNAPLSEAALVLAATERYATYCSSKVSDQRLTLTMLGTMQEIADAIEDRTDIDVVVDHENREVRFLARSQAAPRFE